MFDFRSQRRLRPLAVVALAAGLFSWAGATRATPIAATGDGLSLYVTSDADVVVTYRGYSGSYYSNDLYFVTNDGIDNNDLYLFNNHNSIVGSTVDLGRFDAGTELVFRMHVNNTGYDYFTGEAGRNPDDHVHARAQEDWLAGEDLVSFEDLFNGLPVGWDFNDLSFSIDNVTAASSPPLTAVPEPGTLLLLAGGLASIAIARRRSRTQGA